MKTTQEEFIRRSIQVHKNKYDYSKVIYRSNKYLVVIICPVHGDMQQFPQNHMRGNGCRKCGNQKKKNFPRNDELLKEIQDEHFKTYSDFRKSKYYRSAQASRLLTSPIIAGIPRFRVKRFAEDASWVCYQYLFPSDNRFYVGITSNMIKRRKSRYLYKSKEKDPVYQHMIISGERPIETILQENIPVFDLALVENYFIEQNKKKGLQPLNSKPGGGTGSRGYHKWSKEDFMKCANSCISRIDMKKRFHYLYRALLKSDWKEEVLSKFPSTTGGRPVRCEETGTVYSTIAEASHLLGIHHSSIIRALKTKGKSGGFHWSGA